MTGSKSPGKIDPLTLAIGASDRVRMALHCSIIVVEMAKRTMKRRCCMEAMGMVFQGSWRSSWPF
ncbi:hypothetical protein QJS04_geneDACA014937 [Acorus gramineus]|uniref:Uncharacterized protein n=1 Tax=Acorus gramineus TaxID=55184 RepID=A0AAV9BVR8_ACOGR|nr:hypothetical protein QJS04_geneDACA014937 [Acorus gramineus]